jgi:dihydrofolate reductase
MRKLTSFTLTSLDGYFVDAKGDMSWAHRDDPEWQSFVQGNASGGGTLLFGRITYETMASYWPSEMARANDPAVAERMNAMPKVVFSRTLADVSWANTTLLKEDLLDEVRKLKAQSGAGITILGSGTLITQLAPAGLIDEFQFVVTPIVLGAGRTVFDGVPAPLSLKLTSARTFTNGNVVLSYERG